MIKYYVQKVLALAGAFLYNKRCELMHFIKKVG